VQLKHRRLDRRLEVERVLGGWLARRMVLDVFPALRADYRRERLLTLEQVRELIENAGRNAAHAHCCL
jgi:hypothetical protein